MSSRQHERVAADLSEILNPEQYRAATTTEGPLLILAGAGSGKTRVLVHRIAYILEQKKAVPWQIFAVTFTNKAAGEMKSRLEKLIGGSMSQAWIGTFHSLCARLLRIEAKRLGYGSNFTIYDAEDSKRLLKRVLDDLAVDTSRGISVASVANEIDRAKNKGLGAKAFAERPHGSFESPAQKIARAAYPRYQRELARANAMDFGDLLLLAVELLAHHPEVRRRYSDRFRYVMVDEFQDTNAIQYDLLKLLVTEHQNLGVVGDDDQSIYRWRGAEVSNILEFHREFSRATIVKLEENYRSTGNILSAANAVIAQNARRHQKSLRTQAGPGAPVGLALLETGEQEARLVAELIRQRIGAGERPEDFAILYRANAQSRPFEEALGREKVPYTVIGGTGFYERMEVKDVVAYLRVTANPASTQDFERIVNVPSRKIGAKTVEKLRAAAERAGVSGANVLSLPNDALAGITRAALEQIRELDDLLSDFRELAADGARASDIARVIIDRIGYEQHLRDTEPQNADDRIQNVSELVSSIAEFEQRTVVEEGRTALEAFLEQAALTSPDDQSSESGSVSLLTLHSAKGLEFPVVFMVGMEDQTFPSKRALENDDREAMEEERRLCYVGMTRAMRELHLTAARLRRVYGTEEVRRASRFLADLPNDIVGNMPLPRLAPVPRRIPRGSDEVVYDDYGAPEPEARAMDYVSDMPAPSDGFHPGARIHHNLFGIGTIEEREGSGKDTRLRVRFPGEADLKTVVARFVSLAKES
jgi:DNA helicase-2/ATP-dependent DNA helicase PcrA